MWTAAKSQSGIKKKIQISGLYKVMLSEVENRAATDAAHFRGWRNCAFDP